MTDFGAGIFLDSDLDFEVDESGDIRTTSGASELEKDLAFFVISVLNDRRGQRIDNRTLREIELITEDVLDRDPRVDSVSNVEARDVSGRNTIELIAKVIADTGEQELVIEV